MNIAILYINIESIETVSEELHDEINEAAYENKARHEDEAISDITKEPMEATVIYRANNIPNINSFKNSMVK